MPLLLLAIWFFSIPVNSSRTLLYSSSAGGIYTKTVEYEDINYSVASTEDQTAIFGGWSSFLNYFDSFLPFQLSFINRRSCDRSRYKVNIPPAEDEYNSVREEFTGMLKNQIAKSNNGIERSKYITFGLPAEGVAEARPRLERVEADVMGNLHRLGVQSRPLDGRDRLAMLHGQMHPGSHEPFRFSWKDIPKTGLGTKDYIAPDSFDFRDSRTFRVGRYFGAVSYLQMPVPEPEPTTQPGEGFTEEGNLVTRDLLYPRGAAVIYG